MNFTSSPENFSFVNPSHFKFPARQSTKFNLLGLSETSVILSKPVSELSKFASILRGPRFSQVLENCNKRVLMLVKFF